MSHPEPEPPDAGLPPEPDAPAELGLATGFPQATRDQWRELAAGVLRKAGRTELPDPVEDALRVPVATGVDVAPLYTAEDAGDLPTAVGVPGSPPFVRGGRPVTGSAIAPGTWDVRQRHADPDPQLTRDAVMADLENGVTSLWLVLGEGAVPVEALPRVLADVYLDLAPVTVQGGTAAAEAFLALVHGRTDLAPGGSLGLDPIGDQATSGTPQDLTGLADLARRAEAAGLRAVVVDGTVFHDAGAGVVEELGCAVASGVAYLRALTAGGLDTDQAFGQLEFRLAATADQFTTIAALRAARRLWDRVGEVSGASPEARAMRQHAVTSSVMTTRRDPWVNMLRTTLACFAAGVGGADAVTVQPFDAALGLPDAFARRIARNTQTLLVEEGHLARVLDPAGGSWYVESLTDSLAGAAWAWFTEIERAGGIQAALASGLVGERIAAAWSVRAERLAHRTDPVTGVSEFPNPAETLPERRPAAEVRPAGPGGLPRVRAAGAFEELRDRADAAERRPAVYLATIGPVARHTARASFAANLFQAGGLDTPTADGASGLAAASTTVAVLCGSDKEYPDAAPALVAALREAGATRVLVAGKPSLGIEGADGYVHAGCDAVAVLGATLDHLLGAPGPARAARRDGHLGVVGQGVQA
ncbi:methylmalonyl-CoA mutase [Modestobacter sp. I12A-02628]|uniref:methylmalonyl-CoA mutase n=1 Tax=Goekera deserti TaxID=2497753 RepID=A0A7K3W8C1_9ACTN|nr:methylmalonyl-CoA mutase family protein [Goekera deserti]MPR00305.1 methylmalonyl-CoA mutase [Goekera deserti]NDI49479.1 methylmalonyl-CoA mutase [Goekera deserti]NEL52647.1 methylmalonyl-CoA mutase [Goekera deserti]